MTTIKKKTDKKADFKKLVKSIERSNKTFQKADQAKKIMMVAKDVLALLDLKRIEAQHGYYVGMPNVSAAYEPNCQVSDLLKMPDFPACSVCALGAGMIASTLRLNDVVVEGLDRKCQTNYIEFVGYFDADNSIDHNSIDLGMSKRAIQVFSYFLLRYMELAFEDGEYEYDRVARGKARLRAIYKNLVNNKGKHFTCYRSKANVWSCELPRPKGSRLLMQPFGLPHSSSRAS
jgi:hypothetical protein